MQNNKILTLLGFASKAGKLGFGMLQSVECLKKNKAKLIVLAYDVSEKSKKEILFFTHNKNVDTVTLDEVTMETLSAAVGKRCGIISVNDNGFADSICKILGGYANDKQI